MAERKGLDLGNLNPICEKWLNKLDVRQVKGRWNVCRDGEGGNPVKDEMHEPTVEGEGGVRGERDM